MSQPTDMSQPMPNPYTINPDRNMDMDRNPQSSNMDSNLMDTDRNLQNMDRYPQSTDMNQNMDVNRGMNQNMDVNRGTQAPIQPMDTQETTRQGDVGYNPELFPKGWNSQDKSTWSAEEKLKAAIPGTKEHKIQSNLKKTGKE